MARIFDSLAALVPADARIERLLVGIFWTSVRSQYGASLSATAHRWVLEPLGPLIPKAGQWCGKPLRELFPLYDSASLTARAAAVAALGAAFDGAWIEEQHCIKGLSAQNYVLDYCQKSPRRLRLALVGHFHFAESLRAQGLELDIFELEERCQEGDICASQMPERLSQADVVMLTSSTLLTHAIEKILSWTEPAALKVVVGPSLPLHPKLWDFGFDVIAGSRVIDPIAVEAALSEGATHKQLSGVEKCLLLKPSAMF